MRNSISSWTPSSCAHSKTHIRKPPLHLLGKRPLLAPNRNNILVVHKVLGEVAEEVDEELADVLLILRLPDARQGLQVVEERNVVAVKLELFEVGGARRVHALEVAGVRTRNERCCGSRAKESSREDSRSLDVSEKVDDEEHVAVGAQSSAVGVVDLSSLRPDLDCGGRASQSAVPSPRKQR